MKQWTLLFLMATASAGSMLMEQFTLGVLAASVGAGSLLADRFTGWITDQQSATAGVWAGDHKKESGQPLMFVDENDKKMYVVSDPEKLKKYAGKKVTLTGKISGDSIEAESVAEVM
jgi:hypothetical protein